VSKLAEITYFCKITSTSSCLVYERVKYYLHWSSRSVWITEGSSDVWIQWCRHEVSIVCISCTIELVSIYLLFWWYASSVNNCPEVEQYSVVIRSSLLQETFLRRYIFPRIHIQGKESSCPDLRSICRTLNVWFSITTAEGGSLRSNIINYCMWLSSVFNI